MTYSTMTRLVIKSQNQTIKLMMTTTILINQRPLTIMHMLNIKPIRRRNVLMASKKSFRVRQELNV